MLTFLALAGYSVTVTFLCILMSGASRGVEDSAENGGKKLGVHR